MTADLAARRRTGAQRTPAAMIVLGTTILATISLVAPLVAAEPPTTETLSAAVSATAADIALQEGRLVGTGGEWLREHAASAAAVVVGESHGVAEVPQLVTALYRDLHSLGFHHLAIETGPVTAEAVEERLRRGGDAYDALVEEYPLAVPFYGWRQEADLLRAVVALEETSPALWGIDQEFVMSPPWHLATLAESATTEEAAAAVGELQARPFPEGAPLQAHPLALTSLQTADIDALRSAFGDDPAPVAARLLDEIAKSHEIYRLFIAGDNYGSNAVRADLLRRNLLAHYRAAEAAGRVAPRFVAKVGLAHAYRGRTPNNAFDVGNLAMALADEQGLRALNVGVVCGPGGLSAGFAGSPPQPCDAAPAGLGVDAEGGWVLFDLAAVRPRLHMRQLEVDDEALERLVWNLDALVVLTAATPAEAIADP